MKKPKRIYFKNKEEWRKWLEDNHDKETRISLIKYKKHTGKPSMSHKESMQEAICFGWIDTTIKRLDDSRYLRNFVRRNDKSRWSNATLGYARQLIKEKRMSPAGLKFYKEGLKKPVIDHGLPRNPNTPQDLTKELSNHPQALENFNGLAPSYRRTYIYWIERAKRLETRLKRINLVVKNAANNKKPGL